ncbi:uncharacterized protein LOC144581836 [Callithrix jacchus]
MEQLAPRPLKEEDHHQQSGLHHLCCVDQHDGCGGDLKMLQWQICSTGRCWVPPDRKTPQSDARGAWLDGWDERRTAGHKVAQKQDFVVMETHVNCPEKVSYSCHVWNMWQTQD